MRVVILMLLGLSIGACSADRDFEAAQQTDSSSAWDAYLKEHPSGAHASVARARLAILEDERAWQAASSAGTATALQEYLRTHPAGAHAQDALMALTHLNLASPPAPAVTPALPPPAPVAAGVIKRVTVAPPAAAVVSPPVPPPPLLVAARRPTEPSAPVARVESAPASSRAPMLTGYRIQLGAFAGSALSERAWKRLMERHEALRDRKPLIAAARAADGRAIYRLQVPGLDRAAARALCVEVVAGGDDCILVPPLLRLTGAPAPSRPPVVGGPAPSDADETRQEPDASAAVDF